MGGSIFSFMLGILLLFGGNQNRTDLLDTLSTNMYWQLKGITPSLAQLERDAGPDAAPQNVDKFLKDLQSDDFQTRDKAKRELEAMGPVIAAQLRPAANSKDAEVAAVASGLLKNFSEHPLDRSIRRLMAIRTLGERKEKDALALLNSLADSRELFVPDYARRAVAQIEGKPYQPADESIELQRDVSLLPAETGIVGQTSGLNHETLTLASVVDICVDAANAGAGFMGMGGPPDKKLDKKQVLFDASRQLLGVIERVGNVRLDAVTFGYNQRKEDGNWGIIIVRGKYDAHLMYAALKPLLLAHDAPTDLAGGLGAITRIFAENAGNFPMIVVDEDMCILFPNDQQLVVVITEKASASIREIMCKALKDGKGGFAENVELVGLLKTVDTHAPLWVAGKLTAEMQKDDTLGAFPTFTLNSKSQEDGTAFTLRGLGSDPAKVKASIDKVNDGVKSTLGAIQQEAQAMPMLAPVAEFIGSIKISADEDGKSATLTGKLKSNLLGTILGEIGPMALEALQPHEATAMPVEVPVPPPQEVLPNPIETRPK